MTVKVGDYYQRKATKSIYVIEGSTKRDDGLVTLRLVVLGYPAGVHETVDYRKWVETVNYRKWVERKHLLLFYRPNERPLHEFVPNPIDEYHCAICSQHREEYLHIPAPVVVRPPDPIPLKPVVQPIALDEALKDVAAECVHAMDVHGPYHSAHEALGVIEEEFEEFRQEVFLRHSLRNYDNMYLEAMQLAATAVKTLVWLRETGKAKKS